METSTNGKSTLKSIEVIFKIKIAPIFAFTHDSMCIHVKINCTVFVSLNISYYKSSISIELQVKNL